MLNNPFVLISKVLERLDFVFLVSCLLLSSGGLLATKKSVLLRPYLIAIVFA